MKTLIICLLVAVLGLSSCEVDKTQSLCKEENVDKNENNEVVDDGKNDDVIDNGEEREVDPFILSLQGTWGRYKLLHYDKEWKEVVLVLIENGDCLLDGMGYKLYTFNADGTITYYLEGCDPGDTFVATWPCFYDPESRIITVKNDKDEILREYLVSDYDGEYLTLDYTRHLYDSYTDEHTYKYVRETLKRRQE